VDPKHKAAVARILVSAERGTGFLIAPNRVLTALHCIALPSSFGKQALELRPGTIELRFGDPKDPASVRDAKGALLTRRATKLTCHSVEHDVALLECDPILEIEPLELGPPPFEYTRWSTFGFPESSGAVPDEDFEVYGQVLDGTVPGFSGRAQLNTNQIVTGATNFAGISGAPIIVGGRVVGIIIQQLAQDGRVVQNVLFGTALDAKLGEVALPWNRWPIHEEHVRAQLGDVKDVQLRLAAQPLKLSSDADGLQDRTAFRLLTSPLALVREALRKGLIDYLPNAPVLALLLCSARLPEDVVQAVAPALAANTAHGTVHVGAGEACARSLAFRFAVATESPERARRVVVELGVLPGTADSGESAKAYFRHKLIDEVMDVPPRDFEKTRTRWVRSGWDIYVIVEPGSPDDVEVSLRDVYPRVRVLRRANPPLQDAPANGAVAVRECVSDALEQDFLETLDLLG
jgi:hypothetical protein